MENRNLKNRTKPERESMIPCSLLTPETVVGDRGITTAKTPAYFESSSAFLTPPCSQERCISGGNLYGYDLSDPPILDLDLQQHEKNESTCQRTRRSPLLPEDRIIGNGKTTLKVDLIVELQDLGCVRICKDIFSSLNPLDLCRAARVSRKWRTCIKQDRELCERWKSHLHKYRVHYDLEKENLGLETPKWSSKLERRPLSLANQNNTRVLRTRQYTVSQTEVVPSAQSSSVVNSSKMLKRCPNCTSPSRHEDRRNQYLCDVCGLKFCSMCLKDSTLHTASDCSGLDVSQLLERNKKKTRSKATRKDTVGSKRSRDRVRRL